MSKVKASAPINVFVVLAGAVLPACAQTDDIHLMRLQSLPANIRTVSTRGSAEIMVVPDKVELVVAVKTFDKTLSAAESINAAGVRAVIALAGKYAIAKGDIQTNNISVEPVYPEGQRSYVSTPIAKPTGYAIEQQIGFIIRKPENAGKFVHDALSAGANSIRSISYSTTEMRKFRDQARTQALRAAREKAEAFAAESGLKVGKPLHIQEEPLARSFGYSMSNNIQNSTSEAPGASSEASEGLALGRISVKAEVGTTFELE